MTRTDLHRDTIGGSALARWFLSQRDISGPDQDAERDEVLNDLDGFETFATNGEIVLLGTSCGRALLHPHHVYPEAIYSIIYAPDGSEKLVTFWMNKSSLSGLIAKLRQSGDPVDFDELLLRSGDRTTEAV